MTNTVLIPKRLELIASVRLFYFHPPIKSKTWQARRMNILADRVSKVFTFTFPTGRVGAEATFNTIYASPMTTGQINFYGDAHPQEIEKFILSFSCGEFNAIFLTRDEPSDTIHPCTDPTHQPQPMSAT